MYFPRTAADKLEQLARQFKAVAVVGPRQSGKTTLVRLCFAEKPYVSLENPQQRAFATEDPVQFLKQFPEGAVLDEIQRVPELLSYLQQILDEQAGRGRFVLTGSNNFLLLEKITQTLAGRVAYLDLLPLTAAELKPAWPPDDVLSSCLLRGGYPEIWAEHMEPDDWYASYVRTYVERDVRLIRNIENLLAFEKFVALCAGRVGQLFNSSQLALEVGVDVKTIQAWLGVLQASYIVYLLPPYFQNFNKRVTKSPKLYFCDVGLAAYLLGLRNAGELALSPFRGALFENFIVLEFLKRRFNRGLRPNLYFWRDSTGNEIDLLIDEGTALSPVEIKSGQTIQPDFFKGLRFWQKLTGSPGGTVVYAGDERQERSGGLAVRSWQLEEAYAIPGV